MWKPCQLAEVILHISGVYLVENVTATVIDTDVCEDIPIHAYESNRKARQ